MKTKEPMTRMEEWKAVGELLEFEGWMAGYTSFEATRESWRLAQQYPNSLIMWDHAGHVRGSASARRVTLHEIGKRLPRFRKRVADAVRRGRASAREYWLRRHPASKQSEQTCGHAAVAEVG